MSYRTKKGRYYLVHSKTGKIVGKVSIRKSLLADRRKKIKTRPAKRRQGHLGDYKRRRR